MRNILLICKKELKSYFASPIAYLLMAFFGLIFGFGFFTATRDFVKFVQDGKKAGKASSSMRSISTRWCHPIIWSGKSTACSI